ncbi:E3 ubiquitin-protein ligase pellino homolog 2-like [Corticium candelabrum]|uniref:E3 ubiquitin-protein ligase pellino homolog 2-like n=1 Tax=Corticium candelabrum TaxID=121492 RepID=UPI002E25364C|nr:E3 ubiquitin-protein ligase pellino homolog 2-like [Corticium candelabrum]
MLHSLNNNGSDSQVHDLKKKLNDSWPQCPVGLNILQFPSLSKSAGGQEVTPYAYLKCGHVHGRHSWGVDLGGDFMRRTCPVCRQVGPYVQLRFRKDSSFYLDTDSQTYSFVRCGHVASESTVKYWNRIPISYGPDDQLVRCPFCVFPVMGDPGYVKLLWDK